MSRGVGMHGLRTPELLLEGMFWQRLSTFQIWCVDPWISLLEDPQRKLQDTAIFVCSVPCRVEYTGSPLTSELERHKARLVLGRGTAREDLMVL